MPSKRSAEREEQEDPLEPWETPESRSASKAWRSDTEPRRTHIGESTDLLPTNLLQWAVTNAPSVLRDMVVASLVQQIQEMRGVIAVLSHRSSAEFSGAPTVPRELVDLTLAAAQAAAHTAFGEAFLGYEAELKFDVDFGGAYVAIALNVRRIEDSTALERAQSIFYNTLEEILPAQAAERAVFSILDRAAK
jgi:hypothetical protein